MCVCVCVCVCVDIIATFFVTFNILLNTIRPHCSSIVVPADDKVMLLFSGSQHIFITVKYSGNYMRGEVADRILYTYINER